MLALLSLQHTLSSGSGELRWELTLRASRTKKLNTPSQVVIGMSAHKHSEGSIPSQLLCVDYFYAFCHS
jgi:hypothetical protein